MTTRIRVGGLACCVSITIALAAGCASNADQSRRKPESVSGVDYLTRGTTFRVMDLHLLNIGEGARLRRHLQNTLSADVLALSELLDQYNLSADERTRVQQILTLIAVQNERFPVAAWQSDQRVMAVLNAALVDNAKYAEALRARNWSKPMWQQ
jgi:hypothetical protein